jgi:predicted PurR-regulated permease PerM
MMNEQKIIDIGFRLMLRIVFIVFALWFLYEVRSVLFLVFAAALTSIALEPVVRRLMKRGLSKTVAVLGIYLTLTVVGVGALAVFLPMLFSELQTFASNWPAYSLSLYAAFSVIQNYFAQFGIIFDQAALEQSLSFSISDNWSQIFNYTREFFKGFIHFIGYIFLALYLSLNEKGLEQLALMVTPEKYHDQALSLVKKVRIKVSQWLYGQVVLMMLAFIIYYLGLSLLGVPYALAIALFGALMEMLPYVGPILAGIPAIFIGLLVSPVLGLSALIFYTVAHQLEAHVLAPQVMKRSAELNPVAFIIAVLIGYELGGPLGIILAVPVTMILSVFVEDLVQQRKKA